MGEAEILKPMEDLLHKKGEETPTSQVQHLGVKLPQGDSAEKAEAVDVTTEPLIHINRYTFNDKICNLVNSTCPVLPKYHCSFGQPVERQEISAETDLFKKTDVKKDEGGKLLGRSDHLYQHAESGLNLVKDDFGVHIVYDCAFEDMRTVEAELLKQSSFYINKAEPILDSDLRNIYPTVDRIQITVEAFDYESQFQEAKLDLVLAYLECFEHTSDVLGQQQLIQAIIDEMARRPRLNLSGSNFRDSYVVEIECLKEKTRLLRLVIEELIGREFDANTQIREYLERTYRLLHEQMENKWSYANPEKLENELNKRQFVQTGEAGARNAKVDGLLSKDGKGGSRKKEDGKEHEVKAEASAIFSAKFGDPKEFANYLGIPFSSLQMLMKEHHERDPVIRQAIHENVSFIKIQEGYPQFIYSCA